MSTLKEAITDAERRKTAVGHFNVSNLEQLKAVARAGMKLNTSVIVGVSEGEREHLGVHHIRDIVRSYNDEHARDGGFRLFLNADHTHSLKKVEEAAAAGFDAVLFDGGALPLEEDIAKTKEAVRLARAADAGILVEGELGYLGHSGVHTALPAGVALSPEDLTEPEDAARFVSETGVDLLAPAVGNVHGMLAGAPEPRLNIERIRAIREAVEVPLVLHGASGNTDDDIRAAIAAGIAIVHIATELRVVWRESLEASLRRHPDEVTPYKVMEEVLAAMEELVVRKLKVFRGAP